MSPRPAVFCGFLHEDPDTDPGLSLPLTNDEREVAAVHRWAVGQAEHRAVEVEFPSSVEYAPRLEATLRSSAFGDAGLGFREQRTVEALIEAAAFLLPTANQERSELQVTLGDYARYVQMGYSAAEPIPERRWRGLPTRDLARLLKSWSLKQVRSHFVRLQQRGLVTAERQQANGPLHYRLPEELENAWSPYSQLPTVQSLTQNDTAA